MSETIGCAFCEQNFEDYNDLRLHASEVHADKLSRPEASRQEPASPTADSTQPAPQVARTEDAMTSIGKRAIEADAPAPRESADDPPLDKETKAILHLKHLQPFVSQRILDDLRIVLREYAAYLEAPRERASESTNSVYLEARRIYCCHGAEFARPTLEKCWKEIATLEASLRELREENKRLKQELELAEGYVANGPLHEAIERELNGPLAQSAEQRTHNSQDGGSTPSRPTNLTAELARCKEQLEASEELTKQLQLAKLPCGHYDRYGHTEDRGAHIICLVCELSTSQQQAAEAEARAEGMREIQFIVNKVELSSDAAGAIFVIKGIADKALSLPATSALALHEVRTLRREAAIAKDLHGSIGSWLETRADALERAAGVGEDPK